MSLARARRGKRGKSRGKRGKKGKKEKERHGHARPISGCCRTVSKSGFIAGEGEGEKEKKL